MRRFHIISCIALALLIGSCAKPSAETLIERFRAQQSTFESAVLSLQEYNGDHAKAYVDDPNFRDTLDQLDLHSMFILDQCHILMRPKANSIIPDRTEKGYAFLCEEPESLVTNIDNYEENAPYVELYQPIEGQWYLYIKQIPSFAKPKWYQ